MAECGYLRSMKQSVIREIRSEEIPLLNDFLYEAIFIPEGVPAPPRSIIENEDLQVYVRDFGMKADDRCLVAEVDGIVVGAVWTRVMNDYGHIAEGIPSLAISLYKDYRGQGIGTPSPSIKTIAARASEQNCSGRCFSCCGGTVIRRFPCRSRKRIMPSDCIRRQDSK